MRSTKASAAIERLRARSSNAHYVMSSRPDGLFSLLLTSVGGPMKLVGEPLPLDEFVRFVNSVEAAKPKPVSKLDAAFRAQLKKH